MRSRNRPGSDLRLEQLCSSHLVAYQHESIFFPVRAQLFSPNLHTRLSAKSDEVLSYNSVSER